MNALLASFKAILDPKAGGDARVAIKLLTLASVIVTAFAGAYPGLVAVASIGTGLNALLGVLTHHTQIGDTP